MDVRFDIPYGIKILKLFKNVKHIISLSLYTQSRQITQNFLFSHPDEISATEMLGCMEAMRPGSVGFVDLGKR